MKQFLLSTFVLGLLTALLMNCNNSNSPQSMQQASPMQVAFAPAQFPDFCTVFPVPEGTKETFKLSQNFPDTFDVNAAKPWTKIDFKTKYKEYMQSVLDYCMEGNLEVDFKVQNNKVRQWYNAPWMHDNGIRPITNKDTAVNNGRECLHGLTREIKIDPKILGTKQTTTYQTYAIGFYNAPGGYTIGKVWKNANAPDLKQSTFPDGTVSFKLLFTEADTMQVPYLANSKQWTANIFVPFDETKKRVNTTVRLLQLDIAIKDSRATDTKGWIYGTYIYDASKPAKDWVGRMVPVGLMWGDDQNDTTMLNINNRYNPSLKQSVINQSLVGEDGKTGNQAYVTHLGMGGRMNGPIDNAISSCISCHARAAVTENGAPAKIANFSKNPYTYEVFKEYFTEIPCGVNPIQQKGSDKTYYTTDYSFQLANGIRNYFKLNPKQEQKDAGKRRLKSAPLKALPEVSRDGSVD